MGVTGLGRFFKRGWLTLLAAVWMMGFCTAMAADVSPEALSPRRVARWPGGVSEQRSKELWPDAQFIYADTIADMMQMLKQNKLDAAVVQRVFYNALRAEGVEGVETLEPPIGKLPTGYLFPNNEQGNKLGDQMDAFIEKCRADGTLRALQDKWLHGTKETRVFERPALTGENGVLTVASNGVNMPFIYIRKKHAVGYEVELFALFCAEHGYDYKVEIATSFEGMLVGVETGQYDIGINAIEVTPDRQQKFRMSTPTYEDDVLVVVRSDAAGSGFFAWFEKQIYETFIEEGRWRMLAMGMGTTLLITALATVFGTALGFLLCFLYREKNPAVNAAIDLVFRFFAGMPMMVLLMLFYYIIFGSIDIGGTAVSVVVFSITTGLSVFGMLKSGAASIPEGQMEAALALGFPGRQAFRKFILPQAVLVFFPTYQAEIINLLKFTAIVGYIAVQDLTKMADLIRARTYDAFMPLIAISVLYLILAWLLTVIAKWVFARLDPKQRSADEILRGVRS